MLCEVDNNYLITENRLTCARLHNERASYTIFPCNMPLFFDFPLLKSEVNLCSSFSLCVAAHRTPASQCTYFVELPSIDVDVMSNNGMFSFGKHQTCFCCWLRRYCYALQLLALTYKDVTQCVAC